VAGLREYQDLRDTKFSTNPHVCSRTRPTPHVFSKIDKAARVKPGKMWVPDATGGNVTTVKTAYKPGQAAVKCATETVIQGGWNAAEEHQDLKQTFKPSPSSEEKSSPAKVSAGGKAVMVDTAITSAEGDEEHKDKKSINIFKGKAGDDGKLGMILAAAAIAAVAVGGYYLYKWYTGEPAPADDDAKDGDPEED